MNNGKIKPTFEERLKEKFEKITAREATQEKMWDFLQDALREQKEEIRERMEALLNKEGAKRLSRNLEIMFGKPECTMCGCNPLKQRKMILDSLDK